MTYYALKAISILLQIMPNLIVIIQIPYDSEEVTEIIGRNKSSQCNKGPRQPSLAEFPQSLGNYMLIIRRYNYIRVILKVNHSKDCGGLVK
jgi:hypothetical protein